MELQRVRGLVDVRGKGQLVANGEERVGEDDLPSSMESVQREHAWRCRGWLVLVCPGPTRDTELVQRRKRTHYPARIQAILHRRAHGVDVVLARTSHPTNKISRKAHFTSSFGIPLHVGLNLFLPYSKMKFAIGVSKWLMLRARGRIRPQTSHSISHALLFVNLSFIKWLVV